MTEQEHAHQKELRLQLTINLKEQDKLRKKLQPLQEKAKVLQEEEEGLRGQIVLKKQACPICKGLCKVEKVVQTSSLPMTYSSYETRCEYCSGKGLVTEEL